MTRILGPQSLWLPPKGSLLAKVCSPSEPQLPAPRLHGNSESILIYRGVMMLLVRLAFLFGIMVVPSLGVTTAYGADLKVYRVEGFFEQEIWGSLTLQPGQVIQLRADHVDPWSRRNHTPQEEFTWVLRGFDSGTMEVFEPFWRMETEHFRLRFNEIEFTAPANINSERYTLEVRDRGIGHLLIWLNY